MKTIKEFTILLLSCLIIGVSLQAQESDEQVRSEILQRLSRWPYDFNHKNVSAVCSLFASDLVASYPQTKDRNYLEMCNHLAKILSDPQKDFRYEQPKIEQIIISQDLAVVRLIWTLSYSEKGKNEVIQIRERGLDVFKKQPDGTWRVAISYAYEI